MRLADRHGVRAAMFTAFPFVLTGWVERWNVL